MSAELLSEGTLTWRELPKRLHCPTCDRRVEWIYQAAIDGQVAYLALRCLRCHGVISIADVLRSE